MIKLNNKNITYVALADSNNSLKAPKEIWYADSNNSVKLVYRRKDALIEGEDYEKYHWLEGRNGAYINTNHKLVTIEDRFEVEAMWDGDLTRENDIFGYLTDNQNVNRTYAIGIFHINFGNNLCTSYRHYLGSFTPIQHPISPNVPFTLSLYADSNEYHSICNGNEIRQTTDGMTVNTYDDIYLFNMNIGDPAKKAGQLGRYFNGDIAYFIISNNNTEVVHLVPCKLLKPVPKWLDANGIRRNVGECGMIDLVSGKFYGNINSVGTFTVENYYERKEWLCGRNGAYINTNHKLKAFEDRFEVHARYDGTIRNPNNDEQNIFGYTHLTDGTITEICRAYINSSGRISCNYYAPDGQWNSLPNSLGVTDITLLSYVESTTHTVVLNGNTYTMSTNGMQSKEYGSFIALFSNNGDDDGGVRVRSKYFHGDIAYFKITDTSSNTKMNLIPCTLTMDLPASMDANGIARTKGTSGMWDLVSDRFYGNVASSGTFKAVNLAEGVDYEVHQWLVGDGNTTIKVIGNIYRDTFSLVTVPTTTTANKRLLTSMSTSHDGNKSEYQIMVGNDNEFSIRHGIRINNDPTSILTEFRDVYINDKYEITTYRDGDYYYGNINGVEYKNNRNFGEYQFADEDIVINIYANGFKLGNFNSGRFNLTPVRLLRSIPSKYDANGIARQAGECGMYDTVNDVFYGNVASSGTFSVSDDS